MENIEYPSVFIILLNYNGREHLEYCIPSVLETDYPNYELVVVDNASIDDSVSFVKNNFSEVTLIVNEKNTGQTGGDNVGIKYALSRDADYVVLLDSDIKVDKRWIREAVNVAEKNPIIGMVGFNLFGAGYRVDEEHFNKAREELTQISYKETNNIVGCALFIKSDVLKNIGMYDERYFAYGEEQDLEFRTMCAGYKMVEINVPVWHACGGSFGKVPLKAGRLVIRNVLRLYIKNGGFRKILSTIKLIINFGCNPFLKYDKENVNLQRLRPSNIFVNLILVIYSILWNIIFLPETVYKRRSDYNKVKLIRRKLIQKGLLAS